MSSDESNTGKDPQRDASQSKNVGTSVGAGIAIGVALGAALGNVGLGLALGIVFGAAIEMIRASRKRVPPNKRYELTTDPVTALAEPALGRPVDAV